MSVAKKVIIFFMNTFSKPPDPKQVPDTSFLSNAIIQSAIEKYSPFTCKKQDIIKGGKNKIKEKSERVEKPSIKTKLCRNIRGGINKAPLIPQADICCRFTLG